MMTSATRKGDFPVQQKLNNKKTRQARLLIVTDSAERASGLRASLDTGDIEITCLTTLAELGLACCGHDLAVIDVGAKDIVEVLRNLRTSAGCEAISVLVEASRLASDPALTGVLPTYRAMPCSQADLIALARRRMASPGTKYRVARKML